MINFGQGPGGNVTVNPMPNEQVAPALQFPGMPQQPGAPVTQPFGVVGSPMPGVILQPAQPAQPGRPPGGLD